MNKKSMFTNKTQDIFNITRNQIPDVMTKTEGITSGIYQQPTLKMNPYRVSLAETLGITHLFEQNSFVLSFDDKVNVQIYDELEPVLPVSAVAGQSAVLTSKRYVGNRTYTEEYIRSTAAEFMVVSEFDYYLQELAVKDIFQKIENTNVVFNPTLDLLISNLDTSLGLKNVAMVVPVETFLTHPDIEYINHMEGKYKGTRIIGSDLVTKPIIADWSQTFINHFTDLNVLVNPYKEIEGEPGVTFSDRGLVYVLYSRMTDTAVNPYTCASY